jgi:hypothetical protein
MAFTDAQVAKLHELAKKLKLTKAMRTYCELLMADPERRQGLAAEQATGHKGRGPQTASRWMTMPKVQAYLKAIADMLPDARRDLAQTKRRIMAANEVLERLTEHAEVDIGDLVYIDEGGNWGFDMPRAIATGKSHLIKEIAYDSNGLPKVKVVDSKAALDSLAKYHKLIDGDHDPKPPTHVTVLQILQRIAPGRERPLLKEIGKAMLAGKTINAEAKRVG